MFGSAEIFWLVLAVVFLVLEGCTVAMVSLWFAAGAVAALVSSLLGAAGWLQVAVFLAVSLVLLALLWKRLRIRGSRSKTNVDSIIGAQGRVLEPIDNVAYVGRVKLGGISWAARSVSGDPIAKDTLVRVEKIEGVKVFVSPVEEAEAINMTK